MRTKKLYTKLFEFSKSVAKQKSYDILKSEPMGKWPMGIYYGKREPKWHQMSTSFDESDLKNNIT